MTKKKNNSNRLAPPIKVIHKALKAALDELEDVDPNDRDDYLMQEAKQLSEQKKERANSLIFIRLNNKEIAGFRADEILFINAQRAYCEVITELRQVILSSSLNQVHRQLDQDLFVRVSRSTVVNIAKVTSFDSKSVHLGKTKIPMSREYKSEVLACLLIVR